MDIASAASYLVQLRSTRTVVPALPRDLRPGRLIEAYAIQDAVVAGMLPQGSRVIGYKCACTSPIAQQALEIDRPVFGRLLSHTTSRSGVTLPAGQFVHRVIEAEFGFRIGADVEPVYGGHDAASIADHVDAVVPAIEIVDYRYETWTVGAFQVAADNAIHGWWIHGEPVTEWRDLDLASSAVEVTLNGPVVTTGRGANVLGHPLNVLAWLADELPRFGHQLRAGDFVTTGVATDVIEASAGDHVRASFDGVGDVELTFG